MKKVLVVDDQRMSRENMEHTIAEMGGENTPFPSRFFRRSLPISSVCRST